MYTNIHVRYTITTICCNVSATDPVLARVHVIRSHRFLSRDPEKMRNWKDRSQWYAVLSRGFDRDYLPLFLQRRVSAIRVPSHLHRGLIIAALCFHLFLDIWMLRRVISARDKSWTIVVGPQELHAIFRKLRRKDVGRALALNPSIKEVAFWWRW